MKKENLMPSVVLGAICLVVALLLSAVNLVTGPIIQAAQDAAANEALLEVLPDGKNFEEIEIDEKYPSIITKAYKADGGYVFQATVTGKSSGLIIMCGVNAEGKIVGTKVIAEQETDSYDVLVFPFVEGLDGAYKDMDLAGFNPYLVSGATLTSRAYGDAMKASLQAFVIASGGSVDIRTPEQIIQDNCNAALGTADVKYSKWFATEVITGIDAVYEAESGVGRVFVIGESFIGVKADGSIVNAEGVDTAQIEAANAIISASTLTDVTKPAGTSSAVTKISKTESGNYVFEVKASGFSAEYYGEEILIKLSISSDGKIIDVLTLSHEETKGYGDKCATEEYYESWRGVGADEIVISGAPIGDSTTDPGAISGATYTSNGYQRAVKAAFNAFKILNEGGNS